MRLGVILVIYIFFSLKLVQTFSAVAFNKKLVYFKVKAETFMVVSQANLFTYLMSLCCGSMQYIYFSNHSSLTMVIFMKISTLRLLKFRFASCCIA